MDTAATGGSIEPAEGTLALPQWLVIAHVDTYMNSPALLVAIRAWLEIEERGHGDGGQLISWNHPAFVAWDKRDRAVCGILAYDSKDDSADIHVRIGYVEAAYRRQGVYSHLWHGLVARARRANVRRIVGTTHADNEGMRRLAVRLGRRQTPLVQYEQDLRPPFPEHVDTAQEGQE